MKGAQLLTLFLVGLLVTDSMAILRRGSRLFRRGSRRLGRGLGGGAFQDGLDMARDIGRRFADFGGLFSDGGRGRRGYYDNFNNNYNNDYFGFSGRRNRNDNNRRNRYRLGNSDGLFNEITGLTMDSIRSAGQMWNNNGPLDFLSNPGGLAKDIAGITMNSLDRARRITNTNNGGFGILDNNLRTNDFGLGSLFGDRNNRYFN